MAAAQRIEPMDFNIPKNQSLRKSVQRLRWFKSTIEDQVEAATTRTGIEFEIDNQILTECFLHWIRGFEASKPTNPEHRLAYVGFTAGRMLGELITRAPLRVVKLPKYTDQALPEYFWPEGYVYVSYCLNVRLAVLQQDFDLDMKPSPSIDELRTWWSFKENVIEVPDYAISFLDLFAGEIPSWQSPSMFNGNKRTKQLLDYLSDANNLARPLEMD